MSIDANQNNIVLELKDITVGYNDKPIIQDVSFNISKGEIVGLLGENGAGKTTTIYTILNLLMPWKGLVKLHTDKIGFMLDNTGLLADLTVNENYTFFSKLKSKNNQSIEIKNIFDILGVNEYLNKRIKHLSTGLRKRVEIGRALLNNPDFLILDEPTEGIDAMGRLEIKKLIEDLVSNFGCSVLLTTHNLLEAENICDRFVFIKDGRTFSVDNFEPIKASGKTLESFYLEVMKK